MGGQSVVEASEVAEGTLVVRAQAGDSSAFAALVRSYQRRAVSVAFRLVNHSEDAADVAQDAFVRAYHNLGQLDNPERFGPWLMRVVTTQALNFRRGRKNRQASSLDETMQPANLRHPSTGRRLAGDYEDPAGPLPQELQAAINTALAQLPEKQRLALILFSVEGMPQKEVAEILECSLELVKWNVFQARKKLKDLLQEYL